MKSMKVKKNNFLLVNLKRRDSKYLEHFKKIMPGRTVRSTDKFFSDMLTLHIKEVFIMTATMLLESEKKITKKHARKVFKELDKTMNEHAHVVKKYYVKLANVLDGQK